MTQEFGPEQTRIVERERVRTEINQAIEKFTPVISHWLKRAYRAGFNSTADTSDEGFINFCKINGIVDDNT